MQQRTLKQQIAEAEARLACLRTRSRQLEKPGDDAKAGAKEEQATAGSKP